MKKRFDEGLKGFILLPCELIDKNGDNLKECILKYSEDWGYGSEFEKWIETENHFTNTLVDRIVIREIMQRKWSSHTVILTI